MKYLNNFIFTFVFSLSLTSSLFSEIITRAALDIGSGETKLTVADVDTELNQIVTIWYQEKRDVLLKFDLLSSKDGNLSKDIEEKLIAALNEMKDETEQFAPSQWFGVGTSVFRTAKNGQKILDRIKTEVGATVILVPQIEEGEIGFMTAVAASGKNPDEIIAWDSGSGSFQMTALIDGEMKMYGAEFAYVSALEALFNIRGKPVSKEFTNPVSLEEAIQLIATIKEKLPPIPEWLYEKNKEVVSIGAKTTIFGFAEGVIGRPNFTKDEVLELIEIIASCTDEQLKMLTETPDEAVVSAALLYAVMDHCAIDDLTNFITNGSCEGLLVMPRYWD